jgi:outer membrane autotransporter protein
MAPGGGNVNVTNTGTLNGAVALYGSGGNTLTNSGLITVTGQLNPGGGVTHVVDGTYTQTGSGVFNTRMSTNNAPGNYDTLRVLNSVAGTGVANLGGSVSVVLQPGLYGLSTTYPGVFTFSSSTGSFNGITEPYLFLNASAVYNPTSVDIVVTRTPFPQIPGGGTNAQAVANVLEANYSTSLTGSLANFYIQLLQSTAPNTLSQLTGEVATAPQNASFTVFGQFLGTIFGQTGSVRALGGGTSGGAGGGTAAAQAPANSQSARVALADACVGESCDTDGQPAARRYTAWAQGFGGSGSIDSNTTVGSSRVDMSTGGGALGMDIRLDRNALVGITLGTTAAGYTLTDIMSSGGARSIVFGLYGGYTAGPAYIDGALAYAYNTYTSNRFIGTGSISEIENASFSASQYGGRVESGWRFSFDRNVLTPFAGLTVQALSTPAFTETSRNATTGGPGMLGVSVQAQTTTSVRSTLGAQFETAITANDDAVFRPRVRLGWAHEYNTNRSATVTLSTVLPNAPFLVTGAQQNADSLVVGAGFELELHRMVRLYGQFDGDFASNARAFCGTGGVRLVW